MGSDPQFIEPATNEPPVFDEAVLELDESNADYDAEETNAKVAVATSEEEKTE